MFSMTGVLGFVRPWGVRYGAGRMRRLRSVDRWLLERVDALGMALLERPHLLCMTVLEREFPLHVLAFRGGALRGLTLRERPHLLVMLLLDPPYRQGMLLLGMLRDSLLVPAAGGLTLICLGVCR